MRDLRLHFQQVCARTHVLLAPHLRPVSPIDQLDADRETVIALQNPPGEDADDVQRTCHLLWVRVLTLVPGRGAVGDDLHPWQLRKAVDQALADAVGQIVLRGILAGVLERQHGE
jgi:hypothetical protein